MAGISIATPGGQTVQVSPQITCRMDWSPAFGPMVTASLNRAQQFIDTECLRYCSAMVPFQQGFLQKSGIAGTAIGSGEMNYRIVYAAKQFYDTADTRSYDPNRGAHWFDRMKTAHKEEILQGAQQLL